MGVRDLLASDLPEASPEVVIKGMQAGIAGNHCAEVRPILGSLNPLCPDRILLNVVRQFAHRIGAGVGLAQNAVVGLLLESGSS